MNGSLQYSFAFWLEGEAHSQKGKLFREFDPILQARDITVNTPYNVESFWPRRLYT